MAEQGPKGSKGPTKTSGITTGTTPKDTDSAPGGEIHWGKNSGGTHGTNPGAK